jgi:hypothetical protein
MLHFFVTPWRLWMKVFIPLVLFFATVAIGFIFVPVPLETLVRAIVTLAIVEWAVYHFARRQAVRQRIGIVVEQLGPSDDVKFLNNPWSKGWGNLPTILKLATALQIAFLVAVSLVCGEMMQLVISRP